MTSAISKFKIPTPDQLAIDWLWGWAVFGSSWWGTAYLAIRGECPWPGQAKGPISEREEWDGAARTFRKVKTDRRSFTRRHLRILSRQRYRLVTGWKPLVREDGSREPVVGAVGVNGEYIRLARINQDQVAAVNPRYLKLVEKHASGRWLYYPKDRSFVLENGRINGIVKAVVNQKVPTT